MTDTELKELVASLAISQQKTDAKLDKIATLVGNIANRRFSRRIFLS
ncbi:MAG: hypothetical protein QM487_02400 [Candidatus Marithrix sp.]